jgi:hypothetical protein
MRSGELFYGVMLLTFIYSIFKFRSSIFFILIILLFYDGMFASYGDRVWNIYKIFLPIIAIYCASKYKSFTKLQNEDYFIIASFLLFSFSFLLSAYLNGDYFTITFSQYAKYLNLFLLFFTFKRISINSVSRFEKCTKLLYLLLVIQIVLTILKFLTWGFRESVVGSISDSGGAAASVLPLVAFIFLWLYRKGVLRRNDWIFTLLLMCIGIVSMKRAIMFIMPVVIFLFLYYVPKKRIPRNWVFAVPLMPIVFYFAVRLNPTFNKENSKWGTFDLNYVINSSREYTFGSKESREKGQGRGGATLLLLENMFNKDYTVNSLFGYGLKDMYATDYDQFEDLGFGINHKGSATGIFQSYVSIGYFGILFTLIFAFSMLRTIKEKRIRYVIYGLFCWEYILYTGNIIRNPAIIVLLVFIIAYANISTIQFNEKLKSVYYG